MAEVATTTITTTSTVEVPGVRPYPVLIGRDLIAGELRGRLGDAVRVAVVYAAPLTAVADRVADAVRDAGITVLPLEVPDAEAGKTVEVAGRCWEALGRAGFTRTDVVIGVGGGAVTDLAGFVAACWTRGLPVIQVPTSLTGMVDAAVGGKTGVNVSAGKNLVGAFHQPSAVLCDLSTLDTLPEPDLRAGLAEVVKCGFIADPVILDRFDTGWEPALPELIARSVAVKAAVVGADPHEAGLREILNYGHTLGHAIEKVEGYRWRHGDAISVGLVYAAALGRLSGRLDAATADRHRTMLAALGLPVTYRGDAWPDLLAAMRVDKKARGSTLRFVVLDGLAKPSRQDGPDDALLAAAYQEVVT